MEFYNSFLSSLNISHMSLNISHIAISYVHHLPGNIFKCTVYYSTTHHIILLPALTMNVHFLLNPSTSNSNGLGFSVLGLQVMTILGG